MEADRVRVSYPLAHRAKGGCLSYWKCKNCGENCCINDELSTIRQENKALLEGCRLYRDDIENLRAQFKIATDALVIIEAHGHHPNHDSNWAAYTLGLVRVALRKIQERGK
jgi:hypothetical protein